MRAWIIVAFLLLNPLAPAVAATVSADDFAATLNRVRAAALAAGVRAATIDTAFADLRPDPGALGGASQQSEFLLPLERYLAGAASSARAARGQALARTWASPLAAIEARYGVPRSILLAVWGLESEFGAATGTHDVLSTMATRAAAGTASDAEVVATLQMLDRGVPRTRLRGSWAGATGGPQFLPSAYAREAVAFTGGGLPDIWTSAPDTLASIAHFLQDSGWQAGLPAAVEVRVPQAFAYDRLDSDASAWRAAGFVAVDGSALPGRGMASLFLPAGANGPAFLLTDNFAALKAYNFSDSYAMAAAVLASRIAGQGGVQAAWPKGEAPLTAAQRIRLQQGLVALGFYRGTPDGRFGPFTRIAVFAFQRRFGLHPADGYPSANVLARIDAAR